MLMLWTLAVIQGVTHVGVYHWRHNLSSCHNLSDSKCANRRGKRIGRCRFWITMEIPTRCAHSNKIPNKLQNYKQTTKLKTYEGATGGNEHHVQVILQPGELLLYESARLPHGRTSSLRWDQILILISILILILILSHFWKWSHFIPPVGSASPSWSQPWSIKLFRGKSFTNLFVHFRPVTG